MTDLILNFRVYELGPPRLFPLDYNVGVATMIRGAHCAYDILCNDIMQLGRGAKPQSQTGIATAAVELAEVLIARGEHAEAESMLRACLVIQEAAFPEGGWRIAETRSILGSALAVQQKFEEAKSLLLGAYTDMENDPRAPQKRTHNVLTRIVNLYETWNKPQQAEQWRARPPAKQASRDALRPSPQP